MDYTQLMLGIIQSTTFSRWLAKLKDRAVIMRINARIRRVAETGNFGDAKPEFSTILKVIKALKIKLHASAGGEPLAAA